MSDCSAVEIDIKTEPNASPIGSSTHSNCDYIALNDFSASPTVDGLSKDETKSQLKSIATSKFMHGLETICKARIESVDGKMQSSEFSTDECFDI